MKTDDYPDSHADRLPVLNTSDGVPLYQQIFVILQNKIQSGLLLPGDPVASEQELCEAFGVSRITSRRALNELAERGLVERARGKGTRVAKSPAHPVRASIDGLLENVGRMGRNTTVEVLRNETVPAGKEVARALEMEDGGAVVRAVRVRLLGDEPMSYLETAVPADIGTLISGQDLSSVPLLLLLEQAGVPVATARQTITATLADAEVASALGIRAGAPLIEVRRVVFDRDGRPVEYIKILYRPERYQFEMTMHRKGGSDARVWQAETATAADLAESLHAHSGSSRDT